jgi:hypothetical protein
MDQYNTEMKLNLRAVRRFGGGGPEEQWSKGLIMKYSNRKRVQNNEPQRGEDQPVSNHICTGDRFRGVGAVF